MHFAFLFFHFRIHLFQRKADHIFPASALPIFFIFSINRRISHFPADTIEFAQFCFPALLLSKQAF